MAGQYSIIGCGFLVNRYVLNKRLAKVAIEMEDPRLIGPLVEIADKVSDRDFGFGEDLQRAANAALVRLLPMLNPGDARLFTDRQRMLLRKKLSWTADEKLLVAVIEAIGTIRDVEAMPAVTKLTVHTGMFPRNELVLAAASETVSILTFAQQEKQAKETLLRPSNTPDEPSQALLRPASGGEQADALLLLRTTNDQTDSSSQ